MAVLLRRGRLKILSRQAVKTPYPEKIISYYLTIWSRFAKIQGMKLEKASVTALLSAVLGLFCVFSTQAYDYNGVTVTAENGSIQKVGDELVVTFNQVGTGKLTLNGYALARILVVGGGGSGSTGRRSTSGTSVDYMGNGGSGGEAIEYDNYHILEITR